MVAIIKANLAHRSTPGWTGELSGLVGESSPGKARQWLPAQTIPAAKATAF